MPAPAAASIPRLEIPGSAGLAAYRHYCARLGSRSTGSREHVRLGNFGLEPIRDIRQFDPDVHQHGADQHVAQKRCTGGKPGNGYQLSTLRKPVVTWTNAVATRIATVARARPCLIERTGGNLNWFG